MRLLGFNVLPLRTIRSPQLGLRQFTLGRGLHVDANNHDLGATALTRREWPNGLEYYTVSGS